eukprot:CAMPEP_0183294468 /NCGR_PEP_ID=MMETSP0160_2-20130417/2801_1 /TAXON_ID=2839 ORGANISM="Odontella Sinensis, Strain Grunow 1884" /NCGR_SAMPLE_ID=MMETSP0160_2 /ASSEMBLY_ACC=CAM_ASM_000250 /LENGTH=375 /DNA_ID=CAMNT_0025455803 /DNA_START=110 /DNA_END=1234 /DNA_ORIENTATION=+
MTKVVIVGAGPAGLLAAHYLLQRPNNQVEIYEKRGDFESSAFQNDRTFPISLQTRGMDAVREIPGLESALTSFDAEGERRSTVTAGVCMHRGKSERKISRTANLTVERNHIASVFLRELRKANPAENSSLKICFDSAIEGVDVEGKTLKVTKNDSEDVVVPYDVLIGCDGAHSKIRQMLSEQQLIQFSQTTTDESYKSFYISCSSEDGSVKLDGDKIHVWMFGANRVISAPTRKDESAGVFIFPGGQDPFSDLPDAEAVLDYIKSLSPDSLAPLVSLKEAESLRNRPVATLVEVTCDKLTIGSDIVLLGDAAHAMSPSLSQGCNSSLQDVQVLMGCLDQCKGDWVKALPAYNEKRIPDSQAISELSCYNNPRNKW